MNPEDLTTGQRVAAIIALMMKHKKMTGIELARHFGVSTRSIYRSMADIRDAGLPIFGIANDGYVWQPPPGACDAHRN